MTRGYSHSAVVGHRPRRMLLVARHVLDIYQAGSVSNGRKRKRWRRRRVGGRHHQWTDDRIVVVVVVIVVASADIGVRLVDGRMIVVGVVGAELATTADGEGMPRVATMADESMGDRNSSK